MVTVAARLVTERRRHPPGRRDLTARYLNSCKAERDGINGDKSNGGSLLSGAQMAPAASPLSAAADRRSSREPPQITLCVADDTSLLISDSNIASLTTKATQELRRVQQWFQDNGLLLNTDKTKCIRFCHANRDFDHSLLVKSLDKSIKQVIAAQGACQ
ncbi:unnamed protein product [Callosobruchus maculatus]|uniref:Reverse transcriptase domain-containing protein n=1 Tax=Callosobruchus maculatus TaxID=64391 RepID=A0A653DJI5_CALMS|nr:unnamed protein product [Callosobruchus maculatus]